VTGHNQTLSVETHSNGTNVVGAACTLDNDKGKWFVNTPGSVVVSRSYGDMNVSCTHEKHEPGVAVVKSAIKAMAFGNILFGGPIGGAVDVTTGAAYDYPTPIRLELGVTQRIPGEQVPAK